LGSRTEENPTPVLSFGGVFCLPVAWGKKSFFTNFIRLAKVTAWGGGLSFFFLFFLRKEADMPTRTLEDKLR